MDYTSYSRLSEFQKEQIRAFTERCRKFDHLYYEFYLGSEYTFYPEMNVFYLAQDTSGLVGFLTIYADEADGAEISACVLPARRRQGIFTCMFQAALEELKRFHYTSMFLKTEKEFLFQQEVLTHYPAVYSHSEYLMVCDVSRCRPCDSDGAFSLRLAQKEDLPALAAISADAFGNPPSVAETYVRETFAGKDTYLYIALLHETPVGCVSVDQAGTWQYLFGLCIVTSYRRQGLGRRMLAQLITRLSASSSRGIALAVDRSNMAAMPLYESCGFTRREETQYHEMVIAPQQ